MKKRMGQYPALRGIVPFLLGVVVGILLLYFRGGKDVLAWSDEKLYELKFADFSASVFCVELIKKRLKTVFLLLGLSFMPFGKMVRYIGVMLLGVGIALCYGPVFVFWGGKGILLFAVSVFPQIVCYFPGAVLLFILCGECAARGEQVLREGRNARRLILLLGLILTGCFLEAYPGATFVIKLLKKF